MEQLREIPDIDIELEVDDDLDGPPAMLIETISKRKLLLLCIGIISLFLATVIIGLVGPSTNITETSSTRECGAPLVPFSSSCDGVDVSKNATIWCGEIRNLTLLHQRLVVDLSVAHDPILPAFVKDLKVDVSLWGMVGLNGGNWSSIIHSFNAQHQIQFICSQGSQWCDNATILYVPLLKYNNYKLCFAFEAPSSETDFMGDVLVNFKFANANYSMFELWFRFVFVVFALIVLGIFLYRQWGFRLSEWTSEQRWMIALLVALVGYNNPLFALTLMIRSFVGHAIETVLSVTFICLVLFFFFATFSWLQQQDRMWQGVRRHRCDFELFFKGILVLGVWCATLLQWSWREIKLMSDPAAHPSVDPVYATIRIVFFVFCIMYAIWSVFTSAWAFSKIKSEALRVRLKFFFTTTLIVVIMASLGLVLDFLDTVHGSAVEFTAFLGLFNAYVYTLAVLMSASQGRFLSRMESEEMQINPGAHVICADFEDDDEEEDQEDEFSRTGSPNMAHEPDDEGNEQ